MRYKSSDLARIIAKQKYGIKSSIGASGSRSIKNSISGSGSVNNLERAFESPLEGEKSLQINYTGKAIVSFKFYRHRLADYSRAISEKALIDALQYCGALRGDSEKEIRLIDLGQEKVATKAEERTELTIEYPDVNFDELFVNSGRTDGR